MLGAREVAAPEDCNERATVAAVFIAAWVGAWTTTPLDEAQAVKLDANPAVFPSSLPPPRPRAADSATPTSLPLREQSEAAKADAAKPPESKAAPPDTKAPEPAPAAAAESKPVAVAAEKRGLQSEVAGLGFGTYDGDAGTFGVGVSVGFRPAGALVLAALFEATGERERTLGQGVAAYRNFRFGVGAGGWRKWGLVFGDLGIFPELSLLTLNGKNLTPGRSATAWGAAADLRARLGLTWGRFAPFLFAGGSYALRGERLTLDDRPQTSITLSRANVSAGAGLAFLFGAR
jgi:hypothetical protein